MIGDSAWRLVWALPLVLLLGVLAALVLRRLVAPTRWGGGRGSATPPCIVLRETTRLSRRARLHRIDIDSQPYVLLETPGQAILQPLAARGTPAREIRAWPWTKPRRGSTPS